MSAADPAATAQFLGAFFDELTRWGVRDIVVSPGSRSTPLSCTAYELSRRSPNQLRVFVDVDERGAAFFALGIAKASGRPAALICTSGTAVANYFPAVLEAESSRVPLIVLTGDRPPRLQGLGAPQTCDQLKVYGDHVRAFRQMPLPTAGAAPVALARQAAREACIAAGGIAAGAEFGEAASTISARIAGTCCGGPVHLNFPFDEPLKPNFLVEGLFESGRCSSDAAGAPVGGVVPVRAALTQTDVERIGLLLKSRRALVLAGEGTCATEAEAREVLQWAHALDVPLLADPLSGLRGFDDELVIATYDSVLGGDGAALERLAPEVVVRFGRYPVSKRATQFMAATCPVQVVVDPLETRDFNVVTNLFVRCAPVDFVRSLAAPRSDAVPAVQREFAAAWADASNAARERILAAKTLARDDFEGTYVRRLLELVPEASCLFAANSMSIRALDTFYLKSAKRLTLLCNRGLNGIDGTVSTALGAAQSFAQTTLLTGDLTLLHDVNALALQRELRVQREIAAAAHQNKPEPSIVVVLLNNNGGGIFDMLPQKSEEDYFERLFLTPQDIDFEWAARAFGVPYCQVDSPDAFDEAYQGFLGTPGISLLEVRVPLEGITERYGECW